MRYRLGLNAPLDDLLFDIFKGFRTIKQLIFLKDKLTIGADK